MEDLRQRVFDAFPALKNADQNVIDDFFTHGKFAKILQQQYISFEGSECTSLAIVLSGRARVFKLGENGREITLYRIEGGESCVLTASSILSEIEFPASAIAETDIEAFAVPAKIFNRWVGEHKFWRSYVFELFSKRLTSIITVVEEVAFKRVDTRLAAYLLNSGKQRVFRTHQEIAVELGTSREVVSRILKDFEHEELVTLARGEVEILNTQGLEKKINFSGVV